MSESDAEQMAFEGLAPRRRRRRAVQHTPASKLPIAQVVLDVQATHLGTTFDYVIDERQSQSALPGVMIRVRFAGRRVNGIIWNRVDSSPAPQSSLRYIERIVTEHVLVDRAMRRDITAIADIFGGTRANILRLAVPSRVARVDQEAIWGRDGEQRPPRVFSGSDYPLLNPGLQRVERSYDQAREMLNALQGSGPGAFVLDMLPGQTRWSDDLAALTLDAMTAGKSAVLVMPGMRETGMVARSLQQLGLRPFPADKPVHGSVRGDFLVLSASMPPDQRYRAFCAAASGGITCVVGPRAAMYAPVQGSALFVLVEDTAYQHADGMMPYANARGVLRLRAEHHHGVFVAMSNARSALSQAEVQLTLPSSGRNEQNAYSTPVSGPSVAVHPLPSVINDRAPWIRWLNREELTRLADPTVGARVPHFAVRILKEALDHGPVLLSIPRDGVSQTLGCTQCHRLARCLRCTGPLLRSSGAVPRCGWCGAAAVNWHCPHCGNERMHMVRVGAAGTAEELRGLFGDVPMVLSGPHRPNGVVPSVPHTPMIVIAPPGAEPLVRSDSAGPNSAAPHSAGPNSAGPNSAGPNSAGPHSAGPNNAGPNSAHSNSAHSNSAYPNSEHDEGYEAVAILDAWTSLYSRGVDARIDTLNAWMKTMSLCLPRKRGGQALLIGETDSALARSLVMWDSRQLASTELEERRQTALPPALPCACVWGRRDAVEWLLREVGALDGEHALVQVDGVDMPAVLGPVPIAPPTTMDAQELEETRDRVKAVVRVSPAYREQLALDLRHAVARHVATRTPGELRFQLDPKELL